MTVPFVGRLVDNQRKTSMLAIAAISISLVALVVVISKSGGSK